MKLSEKILEESDSEDIAVTVAVHTLKSWAKDAEHLEQRWISVEEGLPEVAHTEGRFQGLSVKVLTCTPRGRCGVGFYDYETGLWHVAGEKREVAFWMPIPAPPSTVTPT